MSFDAVCALKLLERLPIYEKALCGASQITLMSAVTGISNSASVTYATQLAQTSALKRSLSSLGTAVQNGDLTSASSILAAFVKANPQYASTSSSGSQSPDPINQDFQALTDAISNNQVDTAKSAWTQITGDLAKSGVTDLSTGPAATAQLLAQTKASMDQEILSDIFGTGSGDNGSLTSLLGGSSDSSSSVGLSSSLLSEWLTYKAGGNTSPTPTADNAGSNLDSAA